MQNIVTPSSLTIATMASRPGSDGSISKFSINQQTLPRTMTVDPTMVDLHANGYVNGSLLFTRFRHRLPRNATTQSKSLPIDSDSLDSTDVQPSLSALIRGLRNAASMQYQKND